MRTTLRITKEKIVTVAQKLFVEMSFYGTTMKDIAKAAKISRRTLYTHFNSKEDIFNHIVNQKIELIEQKLEQAVRTALPADKRLKLYIKERFNLIAELMGGSQSIKETFLHNNSKIEILRQNIDRQEIELLYSILKDGVSQGIFSIKQPRRLANSLQSVFKSLEFGFIRQHEHQPRPQVINEYINILFHGIIKK
ncbi:TetR/AcrR family transcriptional regulator [Odoribacter sp. AF15-53]|nr:TetR/AcrR family transcriptional regulator [Butyricimonas paravirosa]RHR83108.1 TetR/AcrR family transcriptional regulator [Odoribacter sp. AF15-53]